MYVFLNAVTATVAERVAAGVAWLDANVPGWVDRIDLGELDLSLCTTCMLGQLFGDFTYAPDEVTDYATAPGFGFERRFDGDIIGCGPSARADYDALDVEWRRVIEARRAASTYVGVPLSAAQRLAKPLTPVGMLVS